MRTERCFGHWRRLPFVWGRSGGGYLIGTDVKFSSKDRGSGGFIMNRKDREISDKGEILSLLNCCDTIRLGLFHGNYPYIVPVSFGLDMDTEMPVIYIHSAKRGLKVDCIQQNQNICVEADIFYKVESSQMGITTRYESVIGFGTISEVEEEEKTYGLKKILEHYNYSDYSLDNCKNFQNMAVYKIVLQSMTGKRNLFI